MRNETNSKNIIIAMLEKGGIKYNVENKGMWDEILTEGSLGRTYVIRCNKNNSLVRIHYWMSLDNDIIAEKRYRLLQACDIINREMFLKARLFEDGIDIIYEIPERASESVANIVSEVLYSFEMHIDQNLLDLALTTDEDLYHYYEERERKFHEEIKKRIEERKQRKQGAKS